jgi:hypothetical protein
LRTSKLKKEKIMPKVLVTDTKGLHQITGNGFEVAVSGSAEAGHIDLKCGVGSNTPAYISLQAPTGETWYLFFESDGTLKRHNAVPTADGNGTVVGAQS